MLQPNPVSLHRPRWQQALAEAISDPAELLARLGLPDSLLPGAIAAARQFPLRVPLSYVDRMRPGDPRDPLLHQVLPLDAELTATPGYVHDPVGDLAAMTAPGLLQKYHGRALLVATGACGVHCRYCFRRHFPYAEANPAAQDWEPALSSIAADDSISEVILSGGDPLSLSDSRLEKLCARIVAIPHVRRLRLHTRLPVVLPERIDAALLAWLSKLDLACIIVLHANHANELALAHRPAFQLLRDAGATLLNQAVLLKGVNDSVEAQIELSERLFEYGVLPYYLHMLDQVQGAAHFEVSADEARAIMSGLRAQLPGYLVPRLVRETAGAPGKIPLI